MKMNTTWDIFDTHKTNETTSNADDWSIFDKQKSNESTLNDDDWSIFENDKNKIEGATEFENATISNFRALCQHPKSQGLLINPIVEQLLKHNEIVKEIERNNPTSKKPEFDFTRSPQESKLFELRNSSYAPGYVHTLSNFQNGITNNAIESNVGWKLHLNVTPENSHFVSRWLKIHNFSHKFLSGGDIDDGKIFTVYIGSYDLCTKMSQKIFDGLNLYLCKPAANDEIELRPGIVGRFANINKKDFHQYGSCGFSELQGQFLNQNEKTLLSFRDLHNQFGDYFYHS